MTLHGRSGSWLLVAGCAGFALLLPLVAPGGWAGADGHAGAGGAGLWSWLGAWGHWSLMVLGMMLPVVAPAAQRVAGRSLVRRRRRSMAWFLLGYLAVWLAIGAAVTGALVAVGLSAGAPGALVIALIAAALWQVSGPRRRVMRRCGDLRPAELRGWRGDRDCAGNGVRIGLRCVFTCGPVMLAMALGHSLALMAGLLALLLSERARGPNPERRAGRPHEALSLAAFALAVGAVALL